MRPVLYISYDGMLEPLGQSQVLGYLEVLCQDAPVHLISFEKPMDRGDAARMEAMHTRLRAKGIAWYPLPYHKTPTAPATAYDIAMGSQLAIRIARRERVAIVHARSYVPAMMALAVKRASGAKFIFDMRGFWADERVDGGLWPTDGTLYQVTKRLERTFLMSADHVVTLTHASARELARFPYLRGRTPPITVIPTCADLNRFSRDPAPTASTDFVFGYVGSVGTWYLFDEVLRFFEALRVHVPGARMLIVNRNEHAYLEEAFRRAGLSPSSYEIVAAEHRDVPALVRRMTVAAAIIKPSYSKMASAPTKLAEYLGCGVPCVGNTKVGDMEATLEDERVGIVLTDFSPTDHAEGAQRLLALLADPQLAERCAATAARLFSLDVGVAAYRGIYASLAPATGPRNT